MPDDTESKFGARFLLIVVSSWVTSVIGLPTHKPAIWIADALQAEMSPHAGTAFYPLHVNALRKYIMPGKESREMTIG